ncbi:hypothetical protein Mgra_00001470 [Meloidogyne graminicola]|uniref:Uncharacterized protein n=1 Tax=Meloidogyne graminicola TaxID=189291 RepID=A0A8T0A0Y2_9BILA|nr:hypothetical protein Mgra_00001470 [Meloidogyne graminicola]
MAPSSATTFIFIRPLFLILIGLSIVLTGVALFTPNWRGNVGLITRDCTNNNNYILPSFSGVGRTEYCGNWWDYQPFWLHTVIVLIITAIIIEIITLLWSILTFIGLCLPRTFIPLNLFCGLSTILLISSILIYILNDWKEIIGYINNPTLGYSFWIAVVASIIMISATAISCIISGLIKINI